jgi:hypothetical protein
MERESCCAGDEEHRAASLPHLRAVEAKVPKKIKKRRMITADDGVRLS